MYHNITARHITEALPLALGLVLEGHTSSSRNGQVSRQRMVGITLTEPCSNKEILNPDRKANLAAQIAETMWMLAGRNDLAFLSLYLPRASDYSDDGGYTWRAAYGQRMRNWVSENVVLTDQWRAALEELAANPDSRRAVISLWDPAVDTTPGLDLPCNDWLSFSAENGVLDLHVAVRSNDTMWGWSGINQFEWASLLEISAGLLGVKPGALHFSITDFHLYEQHWARAKTIIDSDDYGRGNHLNNTPFDFSTIDHDIEDPLAPFDFSTIDHDIEDPLARFDRLVARWFQVEQKIREGDPQCALDVDEFPEPMLRSWLRVLLWWWTGDISHMAPLTGTRLHDACEVAVQPPASGARPPVPLPSPQASEEPVTAPPTPQEFSEFVVALHTEKDKMYGTSWKRRGEMLGIMANLARKVDRLGKSGAGDTRTDTAVDLLVYLAKYHGYTLSLDTDSPREANTLILSLADFKMPDDLLSMPIEAVETLLTSDFEHLEMLVTEGRHADKSLHVSKMAMTAYHLAYRLWVEDSEYRDEYRGADVD